MADPVTTRDPTGDALARRMLSLLERPAVVVAVFACLAVMVAGCGGSKAKPAVTKSAATTTASARFPRPRGRTLQQLAAGVSGSFKVGLATGTYTPGTNRLAFGLIGPGNALVYGPSAVYVARSPGAIAHGPYAAPLDSMVVAPAFRSTTPAGQSGGIREINEADVVLPTPGTWTVLVLSRRSGKLIGGATQVDVASTRPVPARGARPPRVSTDTFASAHGDIASIDTRQPHDDMHRIDFKQVIGKRPVALLFSAPSQCETRVCGPVLDLAVALEKSYGKRIAFIHQEVYRDNDSAKGLRPQARAFGLQSEPWLFTFDRRGRVAAELEGGFGIHAFRAALDAALR